MRLRSIYLMPLLLLGFLGVTATVAHAQQSPPAAADQAAAPLTAAERARYVGIYEAEGPDGVMRIHIYEEGERLIGRPEDGDEPSPLTPLGEHRFRPDLAREAIITFTVEADRAIRFAIAFPDERGTIVAHRRP